MVRSPSNYHHKRSGSDPTAGDPIPAGAAEAALVLAAAAAAAVAAVQKCPAMAAHTAARPDPRHAAAAVAGSHGSLMVDPRKHVLVPLQQML